MVPRRGMRIVALAVTVALFVAACGDDEDSGSEVTTTTADVAAVDLWVARAGMQEISRYNPEDGSVRATIPLGGEPRGVATGEGALWASTAAGTVLALDPENNQVTAEVEVGSSTGLIAAGEGAVWVAGDDGRDLVKIDPTTQEITARSTIGSETERIAGLVVGEGALWLVVEPTFGLLKIDTADLEELGRLQLCGIDECRFGAVALGDETVWVIDDVAGELVSVDPETVTETGRTKIGGEGALRGIAYGPEGLWVLDADHGTVLEVDTDNTDDVRKSAESFENPLHLTLGLGSVWLYSAGSGEIVGIDAETGETTERISISNVTSFVVGCCEA